MCSYSMRMKYSPPLLQRNNANFRVRRNDKRRRFFVWKGHNPFKFRPVFLSVTRLPIKSTYSPWFNLVYITHDNGSITRGRHLVHPDWSGIQFNSLDSRLRGNDYLLFNQWYGMVLSIFQIQPMVSPVIKRNSEAEKLVNRIHSTFEFSASRSPYTLLVLR